MTDRRIRRIDHPAAWHVGELGDPDSFALGLAARHLDALDAAVRKSKRDGTAVDSLTRELFQLDHRGTYYAGVGFKDDNTKAY